MFGFNGRTWVLFGCEDDICHDFSPVAPLGAGDGFQSTGFGYCGQNAVVGLPLFPSLLFGLNFFQVFAGPVRACSLRFAISAFDSRPGCRFGLGIAPCRSGW